MIKIIAVILSLILCINIDISMVSATNYNAEASISDLWAYMRGKGNLTVGSDGLLHLNNIEELKQYLKGEQFIETISICNEAIQDGILVADMDMVEISSVIQFGEKYIPYGILHSDDEVKDYKQLRNGAHGCSVQGLALLSMCSQNYETIRDFYYKMLELVIINPNLDAGLATVGFWISKVEPNGDWDYKVKNGFAPWNTVFCCYYDGGFHHITSEYIGNFNYGYTGKFLFDISTLRMGSYMISGFNSKDKEDWPAIDAGYYANRAADNVDPGFTDGTDPDPGFTDGN